MASTPEAKVKDKIKKLILKHGGYYALPVMQGMAQNGTPDILASVAGVFLGIEAKAGAGKPTELQKVQLKKIARSGGIALVVNEKNLGQFEALLITLTDYMADNHALDVCREAKDSSLYNDWNIERGDDE